MGQVFFVRHGQASFLAENYDKLSALGTHQSQLLGAYWRGKGLLLDRFISGPCVRQRETADAFASTYQEPNLSLSHYEVYEEFAEYSGDDVMRHGLAQLLESDPCLVRLHHQFQTATGSGERHATFQRVFDYVLTAWIHGNLRAPDLEPWTSFCDRVESGITRALNVGSSKRTAIFTSGGPIAIAMRRALKLSPEVTVQTSFMCRNASWSEFLYSASGRFTLNTFNATPHLDENKDLLTYR